MRGDRRVWIDVLRGSVVLLVVAQHSTIFLSRVGLVAPEWFARLLDSTLPFRMSTMFVVAGLFLARGLAKGARSYASTRLRGIVWPLLLWAAFYLVLSEPPRPLSVSSVFLTLNDSYLWFLLYLAAYAAFAWLLRRVPARITVPLLLAASAAVPLIDPSTSSLQKFLFYFALYLLGDALARHDLLAHAALDRRVVLLASLVTVAFLVGWGAFFDLGSAIYGAPVVVATLALLVLVSRLPLGPSASAARRGLEKIGRNTMVLYLAHIPVMLLLVALGAVVGAPPVLVTIGVLFGASVGVAFALIGLRTRFAPVGLLFDLKWPRRAAPAVAAGTLENASIRPSPGSTRKNAAAAIGDDHGVRH